MIIQEEYQAYYHEELIKQLFTRPYIWATHVWNMFDFAADSRAEGGENGMNHKGLVTFDRQYKKDSFYAYKAWLSDEPFVHICGKRYIDRVEEVTRVTIYSNQSEVELFANGKSLGKQTSEVHFFYYEVPISGETKLIAKAGNCEDESSIRKVDTFNESYRMLEEGGVINWFEITTPEGCYNINDKMSDIMSSPKGGAILQEMMAANRSAGEEDSSMSEHMMSEDVQKLLAGFTVKRLCSLSKMSKEQILQINTALNGIAK